MLPCVHFNTPSICISLHFCWFALKWKLRNVGLALVCVCPVSVYVFDSLSHLPCLLLLLACQSYCSCLFRFLGKLPCFVFLQCLYPTAFFSFFAVSRSAIQLYSAPRLFTSNLWNFIYYLLNYLFCACLTLEKWFHFIRTNEGLGSRSSIFKTIIYQYVCVCVLLVVMWWCILKIRKF